MITVRFELGTDKEFISMHMYGHAGFAEMGKDPVCAGASVMAMTVSQCIKSMEEAGKLQKRANIIIRNGRVSVVAKPKPEYFSEALHVFYVGEVGMQLLTEAYPGNIDFTPLVTPEKA